MCVCVWMWLGGFFLRELKGHLKPRPSQTTKFEACTVVCPMYKHVNSWLTALVWRQSQSGDMNNEMQCCMLYSSTVEDTVACVFCCFGNTLLPASISSVG